MPKYMKAETAAMIMIQGSPRLSDLYVTENGEYNPVPDEEDGFKKVTVNVPTYEDEYEELLACQQRVVNALKAETGITAQSCDDILKLIEETSKKGEEDPNEPEPETPSPEIVEETEEEEITQEEVTEEEERVNRENGVTPPSHSSEDPTEDPSGGRDKSDPGDNYNAFFAILGKGWYTIRFNKKNTFEERASTMWWGYCLYWGTDIDVLVTKYEADGTETIVASITIEADSAGNYNWAYDPDYIGYEERPGKTKGWKGNDNSPRISYWIDDGNRQVHITTAYWSVGGGGVDIHYNNYTISIP